MKSGITTVVLLALFSTGLLAQQNIVNEKHQRILTHVEDNIFNVKFLTADGIIAQEGQYFRDGDLFKPHGTWALYSPANGDIVTTSTFDKGKRISVRTVINGMIVEAGKEQLAIKKIEETSDLKKNKLADLKE